jgi:DNA-directed RNA polymerase specialized sigma24 family protein
LIDILPDPTAPIPDRVLESAEFAQALAQILALLPDTWREPFVLHVRDGLTIREVAIIEGVPANEVKQRIDQARAFLRARLAEEYEDSEFPPPTEAIFEALERVEPTPEYIDQVRNRMREAA